MQRSHSYNVMHLQMTMMTLQRTSSINVFQITPQHKISILISDMNAQIGGDRSRFENVLSPHAYGKYTNNVNHFIQFCAVNNLLMGSTLFQHKGIHKIIRVFSDYKTVTQTDHLAIGPSWRMRVFSRCQVHHGADNCSDHRLVTAKS